MVRLSIGGMQAIHIHMLVARAHMGLLTDWQHPGESQAAFYADGLLTRLLGLDTNYNVDGCVARLLKSFTFHVVPCMCPDGVARGHLRTNACGANLNREWEPSEGYDAPTKERSPEVHCFNAIV